MNGILINEYYVIKFIYIINYVLKFEIVNQKLVLISNIFNRAIKFIIFSKNTLRGRTKAKYLLFKNHKYNK